MPKEILMLEAILGAVEPVDLIPQVLEAVGDHIESTEETPSINYLMP
jgi:hypothetical protein